MKQEQTSFILLLDNLVFWSVLNLSFFVLALGNTCIAVNITYRTSTQLEVQIEHLTAIALYLLCDLQ